MPMKILRSFDKMLLRVKSFTSRSGCYKSLHDNAPISGEEPRMEHGKRSGQSRVHFLPDDIPKGYLAVYVDTERKRFVIPTKYLKNQLFEELLKQSEEEFGYEHPEGLTIACEVPFFEHLLWFLETKNPATANTHLSDLLHHFYASEGILLCAAGSNDIHLVQM